MCIGKITYFLPHQAKVIFPEAKCPGTPRVNTASRLEQESSFLRLTLKGLFLVLKAAAAAENPASAFSGLAASAGHAAASISSAAGPSVQAGEDPGTHTHTSKAKRRKPNFPATGIRTAGPGGFQATQRPLCSRSRAGLELQGSGCGRGGGSLQSHPAGLSRWMCGSSAEQQWSWAQFFPPS